MVKRVTVWYADDLTNFDEDKCNWKNHRLCLEDYFASKPMSKRIDWVKHWIKSTYELDENLLMMASNLYV